MVLGDVVLLLQGVIVGGVDRAPGVGAFLQGVIVFAQGLGGGVWQLEFSDVGNSTWAVKSDAVTGVVVLRLVQHVQLLLLVRHPGDVGFGQEQFGASMLGARACSRLRRQDVSGRACLGKQGGLRSSSAPSQSW